MLPTDVAKILCALPLWATITLSQLHLSAGSVPHEPECSDPSPSSPTAASLLQVRRDAAQGEAVRKSESSETQFVAPCSCEAESADWVKPAPRPARCIFIDLGAANGNTFAQFLANQYGEVGNCPSEGLWQAILVEANPLFSKDLEEVQKKHPNSVTSLASTAAYSCPGNTSFFLDTVDVAQNFWGSSMSPNANDVVRSGKQEITVPLVNVMRLITESALPEDYVIVKMDIEGSEHDIVPCLAKSSAVKLVDAMYIEKHPAQWSLAGANEGSLLSTIEELRKQGIHVPDYNSPSF